MKLYRAFKKIIFSATIVVMVGACTGDFEEINTNPTLLTEEKIQTTVLFTSVLKHSIYESDRKSVV